MRSKRPQNYSRHAAILDVVSMARTSANDCFAYFSAVHQRANSDLEISENLPRVCVPKGVTIVQMITVFNNHAGANPQNHHLSPPFRGLCGLSERISLQVSPVKLACAIDE